VFHKYLIDRGDYVVVPLRKHRGLRWKLFYFFLLEICILILQQI